MQFFVFPPSLPLTSCRARSKSPPSVAASMRWIPPSACPRPPARIRPSRLPPPCGSSPMPTSCAKSSANSWRRNAPTSRSVSRLSPSVRPDGLLQSRPGFCQPLNNTYIPRDRSIFMPMSWEVGTQLCPCLDNVRSFSLHYKRGTEISRLERVYNRIMSELSKMWFLMSGGHICLVQKSRCVWLVEQQISRPRGHFCFFTMQNWTGSLFSFSTEEFRVISKKDFICITPFIQDLQFKVLHIKSSNTINKIIRVEYQHQTEPNVPIGSINYYNHNSLK